MSGGPQNFLARLQRELSAHSLPPYHIINPHPHQLNKLADPGHLKIGRLDGPSYYLATSENLANLIRQRKKIPAPLLTAVSALPAAATRWLTGPLNAYLNRSSRAILENADGLIFQSLLSKEMHRLFVASRQRVVPERIIYNGVPVDIFSPTEQAQPNISEYPRLVITASFRLHKRLWDAIALTNLLAKTYPRIKLYVAGGMDILTQNALCDLDVSRVEFLGHVKSEDLPKLYAGCDIGLSPSLFDPCPNSVIEMMASGLPVITTQASGAAELIGHDDLMVAEAVSLEHMALQTAGKIPRIDLEKWQERVFYCLEHQQELGGFILERARTHFDIRIVAKHYAEFIQEVYDAKN